LLKVVAGSYKKSVLFNTYVNLHDIISVEFFKDWRRIWSGTM